MRMDLVVMQRLATFEFEGEASSSRISLYREEDRDTVTWDEFVIVFDHLYIPKSARQTKDLEFINFQQKSMTISEYRGKFTELTNFVTTLDMNIARKARYFKR